MKGLAVRKKNKPIPKQDPLKAKKLRALKRLRDPGRPQTVRQRIDPFKLEFFAGYDARLDYVAQEFKVSIPTLQRFIFDTYGYDYETLKLVFADKVDLALRQKQVSMAMGGSEKLLIHLGKTRLKQRETTEVINHNLNTNTDATKEELEEARAALEIKNSFSS